jgi:hypothetical protein
VTPGTSSYLFAKTDASGMKRYAAVFYSSSRRDLTFYYVFNGRAESASFANVYLDNGATHTVLIGVAFSSSLAQVSLRVDAGPVLVQTLRGTPEDCGRSTPNCLFYVGQRADDTGLPSNGAYQLIGTMDRLLFYPSAIAISGGFPTIIVGLERFTTVANSYLAGANEGGSFTSGVPLAACLQTCLSNPSCVSFDAGRAGSSSDGACFLSYSTRYTGTLRASTVYDYHELIPVTLW